VPERETALDERMMRHALQLAEKAVGWTSPNPMVGAVVCQGERIVAEGFHPKAGEPHAERLALDRAGGEARGGTLYVTLEPCFHQGRTPPCFPRILEAGLRRVVVAMQDPNPLVNGRSIRGLREKGVEVSVGVCEEPARRLNHPFLSWILRKRPWVALKYAMTLDGRIATRTGDSKWISSEESRQFVHGLRRRYRGVLVGHGTAVRDDPLLTCRVDCNPPPRQPVRVVLGGSLPLQSRSQLVRTAAESPVLHYVSGEVEPIGSHGPIEVVSVSTSECGRIPLKDVLGDLGEREVDGLLVEGGATVLSSFLAEGLADEVYAFVAPKILNDEKALAPFPSLQACERMSDAIRLSSVEIQVLGGDALVHGYLTEL